MRKCRRQNASDDYGPGKFGPYTLADTSAMIMTMPVHDPKPVDITRRFRVMEQDNTYPDASGNVSDYHSPQLTCVRSCDWTDQPCGLFIEVDKICIEDWFWHGVETKRTTPSPCQFEGCSDAGTIMFLSHHIEGVHFAATDSLTRHQKGCKPLLASRAHAEHSSVFKRSSQFLDTSFLPITQLRTASEYCRI
ncbi:uncharacterized protein F5891DRAFT_1002184 [Suillus fuscotomentosus]|uniref:Uncharacterized protein n=1 Tax=Suillus fuscotomentosus TaxID=1912939 RepID=A0AAD4HT12_9AGAM|nr:uncharacterized protein F5891DRAFT_1002184 [Suillus fuscotomentosus]KAG1906404.1 hypothetical protein F5891DRAFT_1002184 [Suillus fuscotomentosus]